MQHILMQGLGGLTSLIALHVTMLRSTESCNSVIRECRKFTIDNLHHLPHLPLRYLAINNVVYELIRTRPVKRRQHSSPDHTTAVQTHGRRTSSKGKEREKPSQASWSDGIDMEADDFDEIESGGLEMRNIRHMDFGDVLHVQIFDRRVRLGKL
jgi:hypothetical protein